MSRKCAPLQQNITSKMASYITSLTEQNDASSTTENSKTEHLMFISARKHVVAILFYLETILTMCSKLSATF